MRFARNAAVAAAAALPLTGVLATASAPSAGAIDSPGGTVAPVAAVSTRGTGGTAYVAVQPKSRSPHRPTRRRPTPRRPAPAPKPPAPKPVPAASETPVFPVVGPHSFGNAENRFGAGRVGHIHEGQDVLASEGQQVVAPLAGTVITTGFQASAAGWYVAEHASGTFDFFFAHCQAGSLAVSTGQAVRAGQALCRVGQTGDATGPHLHFEMWVGGWRAAGGNPIDPLPYLQAWERS